MQDGEIRLRRLFSAFTDRSRRSRAFVWVGITLVALVFLAVSGLAGTSTNWFCTQPCHIVHADNTLAFDAGSHVMISCVACHEPVNGSPITLTIKKIEVMPDLVHTVAKTFEFPLNEGSPIALEMTDEYCTQCHHLGNRTINPSVGIIIDHDVHTAEGLTCTTCHNRVAHPEEDITLTLEGNEKHENWMDMDACFRCHSQEADAMAPGACSACHPPEFDLVPATHKDPAWKPAPGSRSRHGEAASEEASSVAEAEAWAEGLEEVEPEAPLDTVYAGEVNTCLTCHSEQYCSDCHGTVMPHPADFVETHGEDGRANPDKCAQCHATSEADAASQAFCNNCHHSGAQPGIPWIDQHDDIVRQTGADGCFDCHNPVYCAECHVKGG